MLKPGDIFSYTDFYGEITGLVVKEDYNRYYCIVFSGKQRLIEHNGLSSFGKESRVGQFCQVVCSL